MPPAKKAETAKGKQAKKNTNNKRKEVHDVEPLAPASKKQKSHLPVGPTAGPAAPAPLENAPVASSTSLQLSAPANTDVPANGGFCLYSMRLPFLQKAFIDEKNKKKDYAALYAEIKKFQAKQDRTAQCHITFPSATGNGYGRFNSCSPGFTEPMGDMPYDIGIASLTQTVNLSLPSPASNDAGNTMGVSGGTMLATDECGITTAGGEFKMRTIPVWKEGGTGEGEIYEGWISLAVKYGLYARKGHGHGTDVNFAFWAIRSKEGDTLDLGDAACFAHSGGGLSASASLLIDSILSDSEDEEDEEDEDDLFSLYGRYGSSRRYGRHRRY